MKYFKPDLLARCRSDDDEVAETAAHAWERAIESYNAQLATFRRELPIGARFILRHFSLHNATLSGAALSRAKPWLSLFVRLEGSPLRSGDTWELKYVLVEGPTRRQFSFEPPQEDAKVSARIQYDEFAKVAQSPVRFFSHSFLLSTGLELRIRFIGLRVQLLQRAIFPALQTASLAAG